MILSPYSRPSCTATSFAFSTNIRTICSRTPVFGIQLSHKCGQTLAALLYLVILYRQLPPAPCVMPAQSSTAAAQGGFAKNMTPISGDEGVLGEGCRAGVNRLRACVGIRRSVVLWLRDLVEWVEAYRCRNEVLTEARGGRDWWATGRLVL